MRKSCFAKRETRRPRKREIGFATKPAGHGEYHLTRTNLRPTHHTRLARGNRIRERSPRFALSIEGLQNGPAYILRQSTRPEHSANNAAVSCPMRPAARCLLPDSNNRHWELRLLVECSTAGRIPATPHSNPYDSRPLQDTSGIRNEHLQDAARQERQRPAPGF